MLSFDFFKEFLETSAVLDNKYKILHTLGEGRYAKVKMAINLEDKKKYAIKIMRQDQVDTAAKLESFMNEVQILSSVQHKHIVRMVYVNLKGECKKPNGKVTKVVYYVMKFAEYGELFEILQKTTNFTEKLARYYFRQLIESVEYLHNSCVGHRDIKTENILIDHKFNLKLADFGCACKSREHNLQRIGFSNQVPIGSPEYNAPEITNNSIPAEYYAEDADVFASAAALFVMVLQSVPFNSSLFSDPYYSRLCKKDTSKFWKIFDTENTLSPEFKDLIEKMMDPSPQKRLTIDSIKKHPWVLGQMPSQEEVVSEMRKRGDIILAENQEKLRNYHIQKSRKSQISKNKSGKLPIRNGFEPELEKLRHMMESTVTQINLKLMKERKEKIIHKMDSEKSHKGGDPNKPKSRRRSSDLEMNKETKEKASVLDYGSQNDSKDKPKMFLDETYGSNSQNPAPQRHSPTFRTNGSKEDRGGRMRRSGSDE